MMVQLVASGRGVCALPNWVAAEYLARDWVKSVSLGNKGVWCTLYAAIRQEDSKVAFIEDFLDTAKNNCRASLAGGGEIGFDQLPLLLGEGWGEDYLLM